MGAQRSILIVDDEFGMRDMLSRAFGELGYRTRTEPDGPSALRAAQEDYFDAVVLDLSMPGMNGLEVLRQLKEHYDLPVVIITAYGSTQTAIDALRLGAYDYVTKPFELEELQTLVERAAERKRLIDENNFLRSELRKRYDFDNIIGQDPDTQRAYIIAAQVARTDATVLLLGETGTGKEYLARTIHYQSDRADKPFVKVNCAALPETLLESELFGHEKGAFTHAVARRIGRFEAANEGTIFLDEIGEMSPSVQAKLLRVLQEKQFERVGGSETISVDVRVIAATNCDLEAAVKENRFRKDLYYRLNVVSIHLPPLRKRGNDIEIFAQHFLHHYAKEMGRPAKRFSEEAMNAIRSHTWPGNIRELENAVQRAVILCNGETIRPEHLMIQPTDHKLRLYESTQVNSRFDPEEAGVETLPATASLKEVESFHIKRVLEYTKWNQSAAAQILGIDRKTLRNKIRDYKLQRS
ncbi:MAG: sigma-54 dependent transcriptional regulator [Armatimonadota bacterium]|nr:sigma-54 dependent transcriptional regulator [Armatimonadota bacterium]